MSCSVHVQFPASKPVTVSVNGIAIPREDIQREMQHHPASRPITAWQQAARALVVRELLLQRAKHLGIVPEPISDEDGRRETDDEALMRAVVDREVVVPTPDDETCRRYYDRNRPRFRSADIYEASHILFAAVQQDAEAYARARANAFSVLAVVRDDPGCFSAMAKAYSGCPSAEQGGNLGQITAGQTTPEFEHALFRLVPGEISPEPVATRYGFHIIRLERKLEGRLLPYEAVAERIAVYLRDSVRHRASAQYVARLAAAARIQGIDFASAESMRVH